MTSITPKTSISIIYSHTGLRGIAAMSVFFCHLSGGKGELSRLFAHGTYAVDFFFILSGFILNWVYLSNDRPMRWKGFFFARVARIMPLYYLTTILSISPLAIYSLIRHGCTYVGKDYPFTLFSNIFMVSGIVSGWHQTLNGPAWSISVEFFCYLIVFPSLVLLGKYLTKNRYSFFFLIALSLISLRALVLCYRMSPIPFFHWHWDAVFLMRGIFGFSVGFFVCSIYRFSLNRRVPVGFINVMILGILTLITLTQLGYLAEHFLLYAFPFLVYFTAFDKGYLSALLKIKLFQWLGERSYSIYLWHTVAFICFFGLLGLHCFQFIKVSRPFGFWTSAFLTVVVLVVSDLSYRYFESPSRKLIRKLGFDKKIISDWLKNQRFLHRKECCS